MAHDPDIHETPDLIASDKVIGTHVYGVDEKHVGKIERLVIEKRSGRIAYAVMSFGGFLGIGHDHYPLPWEKLTYDEGLEGYRTDVTKDQVEGAPRYRSDEEFGWSKESDRSVREHYRVPPYVI